MPKHWDKNERKTSFKETWSSGKGKTILDKHYLENYTRMALLRLKAKSNYTRIWTRICSETYKILQDIRKKEVEIFNLIRLLVMQIGTKEREVHINQ